MSNKPCMNLQTTGCQGVVSQRGNVLCELCLETRRSMLKTRKDNDIDELETELANLRIKLHVFEEKIKDQENVIENLKKEKMEFERYGEYSKHLEKENLRFIELISKLRSENESLVKDKSSYEMTYEQLQLDSKKTQIDLDRLTSASLLASADNVKLTRECELLTTENTNLKQENVSLKQENASLKEEKTSMIPEQEKITEPKPVKKAQSVGKKVISKKLKKPK